MPNRPTIDPAHEARALLLGARTRLRREAQLQAEELAPTLGGLSSSQVRGLANALRLGTGPRRQAGPAERRAALAYFLAWRAQRDKDGESGKPPEWVEQVRAALASLETGCDLAVERLRESSPGNLSRAPEALDAERNRLRMEIMETFLHALERRVMGEEQANPGQAAAGNDDQEERA